MCGLTGFWEREVRDLPEGSGAEALVARVTRMSTALRHRGPDDSGAWVDEKVGLALGFRRLAILDLSPNGHQPMVSADGRFVIVFNGEIYNHRDLRGELEAHGAPFRGTSDTEVMLEAVAAWGVEPMFARSLGHVRDRAVGPRRADALPRSRSPRQEAALLCRLVRADCCSGRS